MSLREAHTAEATNLFAVSDRKSYAFDPALLDAKEVGDFWGILNQLGLSLAVSREYEHFIVLLSAPGGVPKQSPLPLPHPSGLYYDEKRAELIVSSTRTPNLIFWLRRVRPEDFDREIVPPDAIAPCDDLFIPYRSIMLPGSLYIHEIVQMDDALYATITGHNFLAKLDRMGGWQRIWWPSALDRGGSSGFQSNFFQLNGVANGGTPARSFYTGFSDSMEGAKPWKAGYGPAGKGVVFSGGTRDVVLRGLTCPHSPRLEEDRLWLCNSGHGEVGIATSTFEMVARIPGFTRGLAFHGDYVFVGLSRVIAQYEPYAPGVDAATSECGIQIFHRHTGTLVGRLIWPHGYQIFDVQIIPDIRGARLPFNPDNVEQPNLLLRHLG